ncbi:MAG: PTS transporter subunit IIC [Christensenellaceae bacterium]
MENEKNERKSEESKSTLIHFKKILTYIFIDGLSGMTMGLFCTLIIGTIIGQIGTLIGKINLQFFTSLGYYISAVGTFAKIMTGAGIGLGVAYKLKKDNLVAISGGVAGLIGAFASQIIARKVFSGSITSLTSVGEPLGAFIASFVALEMGSLVSKKTKVDIIVTPVVAITCGALVGLVLGPPISNFMTFLGNLVNNSAQQQPVLMGILVAVIMGVCLTLPISSAAIGVSLKLSGIAAGAAVMGCCCHMMGFALMSFKENKTGGFVAQGLGTSMLQMPNLVKHPLCWLPPVIASAILGPVGALIGITSSPVGSGMGTAGLVGPIETFFDMVNNGWHPALTLLIVFLFCIVIPAVLTWAISLIFRKAKWIKTGDLSLNL